MSETVDAMLANHQADTWSDRQDGDDLRQVYDNERESKLRRLEAYIDHCFEAYPIVYQHLERDRVTACVADWDRRRGQHWWGWTARRQVYGKRIEKSTWRRESGQHLVFCAKALIGTPPEEDKGIGWKACVRHELGHGIDYTIRGTSGHGPDFKRVMRQFGEEVNDGSSSHGHRPENLR